MTVAILNFCYFFVEFSVALVADSVSLLADSVDFLEDTAINVLIFIALGWPLARRAIMGKAMALIILAPAAVAGWKAIEKFSDPVAPQVRTAGSRLARGDRDQRHERLAARERASPRRVTEPSGVPVSPKRCAGECGHHCHGNRHHLDRLGLARPDPGVLHHLARASRRL